MAISGTSEVKLTIHAVSTLLDGIVQQVKQTNLPPDDQILTQLEREQLIAILETTLAVLKSPMAEKGLLTKARESVGRAAGSAAEKGVQEGLGTMASAAAERLAMLVRSIF